MVRRLSFAAVMLPALFLGALLAWAQNDRAHELAAQAASQVAVSCATVSTLAGCHPSHPTGCSHAQQPRYDAYLNFLKNQQPARDLPPERVLDLNDFITLEDKIPAGIGRTNHARRTSHRARRRKVGVFRIATHRTVCGCLTLSRRISGRRQSGHLRVTPAP
jgi:hypothetical protein